MNGGWQWWCTLIGGILALVGQWWGGQYWFSAIGGALAIIGSFGMMSGK